jgi:hypothetical protein
MLGSDIALYNALSNGGFITDTYVVDDHAYPITDDCQNWNYVSARGEIFPDYVMVRNLFLMILMMDGNRQ